MLAWLPPGKIFLSSSFYLCLLSPFLFPGEDNTSLIDTILLCYGLLYLHLLLIRFTMHTHKERNRNPMISTKKSRSLIVSSSSSSSPSTTSAACFSVISLLALVLVPFLVVSTLSFFTPSSYHLFSSSSSSSSLRWVKELTPPTPLIGRRIVSLTAEAQVPVSSPAVSPATWVSDRNNDTIPLSLKNRDYHLNKLEFSLARSRSAIRKSIKKTNQTMVSSDTDYTPRGPIYRNALAFHRSYLEMEKVFRVFVYEEGEPPLFHDGPCKSIYSMEGRFISNMEAETRLRTRDPFAAHVHFLPFSVVKMVRYIYDRNSFNIEPIKRAIGDYINVVSDRYPFWNRSLGADHFMLSCHDWGPHASAAMAELYNNSIRVLCNANTSEGFNPAKDVSLPEINLITGLTTGIIGGPSPSQRSILAFFAGGLHGPIRPVILNHWKGKDDEIQVYEYLPKNLSYNDMMRKSKFCICPSGYEVASPRIVEAIYLECVPVIISDHYVLPFSDVLNWNSFSVQVSVSDVPNLKKILTGISSTQYIRMQQRVKQVQRHFVVSSPPRRFDVFYMILHSVWLRRLNVRISPAVE